MSRAAILLVGVLALLASPVQAAHRYVVHHTVKHHQVHHRSVPAVPEHAPFGSAPSSWLTPTYSDDNDADYWRRERLEQSHITGDRSRVRGPIENATIRIATVAKFAIVDIVRRSAQEHGVPVPLALAIIKVESNFRADARNGNARGIGQVLPRTAASVGVHGNLFDLHTGLEAAMRYMKQAVQTHGVGCAAASAYNTGVYNRGRCTAYGQKVMRLAEGMT